VELRTARDGSPADDQPAVTVHGDGARLVQLILQRQ
jgi:hypothetical protein